MVRHDTRTYLAAAVAAAIGLVSVAGLGTFLGFPLDGSLIAGLVAGALGGGIVLAAASRARPAG